MSVIDGKILLTKNPCYGAYQKMIPKGIVVHSTGANNPYIKRYVQPDDGIIGKNIYGNDWNNPNEDVCVHGFIGKDKFDRVKFYQTLPFDICCWGVGGGRNGSYNYDPAYIQFEMCEDDLRDKSYCKTSYDKAVEVCAYLCRKYGISADNIVSHREAYLKGYGSDHWDPTNWWDKFGYTMSGFRKAVKKKLRKTVKYKLRENGALYEYGYKDVLGDSSKVLKSLKKGSTVTWLKDDSCGWSKVKSGSAEGWIMNSHIETDKLSSFPEEVLRSDTRAVRIKDKKAAGEEIIKKGVRITVICQMERGRYIGKRYIAVGGKRYYI